MYSQEPKYMFTLSVWFHRFRHLIPFVGHPLNRKEATRPFFIIGSGRSGNTLVRRILCAHPGLHIPPETYVLGRTIKLFLENRNMRWADLVYLVLSQFEYYPEFVTFETTLRPLAQRLVAAPKDVRSLAFVLDSLYRYHAETKGIRCNRWGDKTPMNTFCLDRILAVFPQAQFIHIIRDGCDVVASYLKSGIYLDMDAAARRWCVAVERASRFGERHPAAYLGIQYEVLVRKPEETVKLICSFLGIEYDICMLNSEGLAESMGDVPIHGHLAEAGRPMSAAHVGKGRNELSIEERQKLQKLIGRLLDRLGYEKCA